MRRAVSLLLIGGAAFGSVAAGQTEAVPKDIVPKPPVSGPDLPYTPFPLVACTRVPIVDEDRYCIVVGDPT